MSIFEHLCLWYTGERALADTSHLKMVGWVEEAGTGDISQDGGAGTKRGGITTGRVSAQI